MKLLGKIFGFIFGYSLGKTTALILRKKYNLKKGLEDLAIGLFNTYSWEDNFMVHIRRAFVESRGKCPLGEILPFVCKYMCYPFEIGYSAEFGCVAHILQVHPKGTYCKFIYREK